MQHNQGQNQQLENDTAESEDEGIGVGTSKQSKVIIIILITIFISAVIYFMFLRDPPEAQDKQVANEIIIDKSTGLQPTRDNSAIDYNITDIIDVQPNDNFLNTRTDSTIPQLPELPQLPDEIRQQIAATTSKKEETFTKEEVDKLIEEKLKDLMEKQMANMSNFNQQEEKKPSGFQIQNQQQPSTPTRTNNNDFSIEDLYGVDNTQRPVVSQNTTNNPINEQELLAQQQKQEADNLSRIQKQRALQERKAAPMFKMGTGTGPMDSLPQDSDSIILSYTDSKLDIKDKAPDIVPTQITDLTRVILQGKVIASVLETAIDTDLASTVRAVITRDVYAEEGKNILIPRGSRVVGSYATDVAAGQTRVTINWNRIIRVDGMSLNITSIGADRLGRAGVRGDLDSKYAQQLANSFLSSVLSVGTSLAVEKLSGSTGITSTISSLTGETTQTSGKASDYALVDATQQFMDDAKEIVDNIAKQKPVIRIPQGEKITIMVTQDVSLPVFKRGQ